MPRNYTIDELARLIDHTNLQADATVDDLEMLCDEAKHYHFASAVVNSAQAERCSNLLADTDVRLCVTTGFPLGQTSIAAKVFETRDAIAHGAAEVDYVVNLTEVKAGNWTYLEDEMSQIVETCRKSPERLGRTIVCKVIFENCLLTHDEKIALCGIANTVKPDFVKTSTGFSTGGATLEDIVLMSSHTCPEVQVKAAGGIRDADTFLAMVRAGASRIGCSAGIPIIEELRRRFLDEGIISIEL